jgi:hypothetical protein
LICTYSIFIIGGLSVSLALSALADTPVGVIPLVGFAEASLAEVTFRELPGCQRGAFSKKLIASDS